MHQPTTGQNSLLQRTVFSALGLTVLIALYLLPGALGHEPWRGDDIRHFNAVYGMLTGEGWLYPKLAGTPFLEYPPLYHWVAAGFATLFGTVLPVHDAARLATPFFAGLAIFWIARTAARLYGRHTRTAAALLTLGTLGLVIPAHENQPLVALMAFQAMTLAGLALIPTQPVKGNLQACAGSMLAFLAAGPGGLLITLPLVLIVALASRQAHTPRASGALILGLTLALVVGTIWPLALLQRAPEIFTLWLEQSWRTQLATTLEGDDVPRLLELLAWFLWPLWPIALWSLWRARKQITQLPWLLPLGALTLGVLRVHFAGSLAEANMLSLIAPMALLATAGVPSLRRGAANAFDWFAVMTFGFFAILVWLAFSAQAYLWPPGLARSLARMAPELTLTGTTQQVLLGTAIVVIWLLLVWRLPRTPDRGPINWAMGMTMLWCLAVTLLLPWFDHNRNYRPVVDSLQQVVSEPPETCIAVSGLENSHLAALDYHAGLRTEPLAPGSRTCSLLLMRADQDDAVQPPSKRWQPIWEYRHAGGRHLEVFRLFRRE